MNDEIATITTSDDALTFSIINGLLEHHIEQLIHFSTTDSEVVTQTSDSVRFADKVSFSNWIQKNVIFYTLLDKENNLKGIIWFEEFPLPLDQPFITNVNPNDYGITFAIRTYDKARGKGLSKKFLNTAYEAFKKTDLYKSIAHKGVWLETSETNTKAVTTYTKFGFTKITNPFGDKQRIRMILESK